MEPWVIEEALLRPAATLIGSALVPLATARLVGALARGGAARRTADRTVRGAETGLAALAGWTALGPALIDARLGWESAAFAIACAAVAFASGHLARRRVPEGPEQSARLGVAIGLVVSLTISALVLAPWTITRIADAPAASDAEAHWRLRVDPWDPVAMLAAGWSARRRESYPRALAWAAEAREHGASEAATLELEAEIFAARGECERAHALFDQALRARAEAAFADPLAAPLELGGYRLPPSLLTECEAPR